MIFAEWMAGQDAPSARAYRVNLVREGFQQELAEEVRRLAEATAGNYCGLILRNGRVNVRRSQKDTSKSLKGV